MITINMDKAKEIHKNKLRKEREPLLSKLDIEFQRALEEGNDTSEIVEQKKILRDVTKHPDLLKAKTINELKELTLDTLI